MNQSISLLVAAAVCSCSYGTDVNSHEYPIYRGTVTDLATGVALVAFCAVTTAEHSDRVVFEAAPGSVVEEEVLYEGRQEKYTGGVPPQRDEAFWCSDVPTVYDRPLEFWGCLRGHDADPPASIMAIEQRGNAFSNGASSGYALKLQIRHSGVLNLQLDPQCLSEMGMTDGAVSHVRAELTVQ
jgi:hypothetical protein